MKRWSLVITALVGIWVLAFSGSALGIAADEILEKVEEQSFLVGGVGDVVSTIRFSFIEEGTTDTYTMRVFARLGDGDAPHQVLLVFLEPELISGTMFLFHIDPVAEETRMWIYLPAVGVVRELVGEEVERQEFIPGTGLRGGDITGGFAYRDGYIPELVGEEELGGILAYVLRLLRKEGSKAEWPRIMLWVHREKFSVLKVEMYDEEGKLARLVETSELKEDELGYMAHRWEIKDLVEGRNVVIEILERKKAEIPDEYFDPESLPQLEIPWGS